MIKSSSLKVNCFLIEGEKLIKKYLPFLRQAFGIAVKICLRISFFFLRMIIFSYIWYKLTHNCYTSVLLGFLLACGSSAFFTEFF